ncbi:hypothetical protein C7974DRAFT_408692 [Boeremia exigua]|uniref:uncharacterized protein n=1 Tax=Boeremia exigua TaxID=749465 RepID=UPI001E8EA096|nr:uncharacterized protein C7974DRAFT_408692 [Boeremia exigua]KAH6642110.1 hypothetical protein C7974DRAFT_408692 [Boeremia exigua]
MLKRVASFVRRHVLQVYHIAVWRRHKLSSTDFARCEIVRRICPRLFALTDSAIECLRPQDVGSLHCVLHKFVGIVANFMLQNPSHAQVHALAAELTQYINSRYPSVEICTMTVMELVDLTYRLVRTEYREVLESAAALANLRSPDYTYEQLYQVQDINNEITHDISTTCFYASWETFLKYSTKEMVAFTRGYQQEDSNANDGIPSPEGPSTEFEIDDTEAEYKGIGKRIEPWNFCRIPYSIPEDAQCSVCMTEVKVRNRDEKYVQTKCGHIFHQLCLDTWVNDSGMKASNTCPSCRTVLCMPRERLHASVEVPMTGQFDNRDGMSAFGGLSI